MIHKRIFWMNVVGAMGWLLMGVLLYPQPTPWQPLNLALSLTLIYACIIAVPLLTAYVIFHHKHGHLNILGQIGNFAILAFFSFSLIDLLLESTGLDFALFIAFVIIVLPATLNLVTLRKIRGSRL